MKKYKCLSTFRRVLLSVLSLLYADIILSQNGLVQGKVLDAIDQEPLQYGTVILLQLSDSSQINGTLTDTSGNFSLIGIAKGEYLLEVRFLGYKSFQSSPFSISQGEQKDVGIIKLNPTARLLEEIEISGRKSRSFHKIDRQVFDAGQFQSAQGSNATEVLRNLPGVSVNGQGEISLRGSQGFIVMMDGRQVQSDAATLLNSLPANAIENIEILTTPSAKFDPDGAGGIINITTRRGATDGFYLMLNGLLGAPSIEPYGNSDASRRYGGDATLNFKKGKWDLSAGLDYRRNDIAGQRIGYVNTYLDGVLTEYPTFGERSFDRENYSARLSAAFSPQKNHSISLNFFAGDRTQYRTADILYAPQQRMRIDVEDFLGAESYWNLFQERESVVSNGELVNSITYYNENLRVRQGDFLIGSLDYGWKIDEKSDLRFSFLYEHTLLGGPTDNASLAWPNIADTLQFQYNTNDNPLDGVRAKIDFSRKLGNVNWESGYQYRYLFHPGDFLYLDRDLNNNIWIENPEFTNRIELERQIHSLYTQFSGKHNKLTYSAGIRLEYMDRELGLDEPDTTYNYEILQPFPTLSLQYELENNWILKAGYSRRIERTTTFKMTPFPEREHNETLEQGDAELLPEFIDLFEVGTIKNWGNNSVFLTGYVRDIQNVINRVNTVYNDSVLNRIYTNAGKAKAIGVEIGSNLEIAKWFQLYLGSNIYNYRIKGNLFGEEINTANTIYSINTNAQFDLMPGLSLQAGLNYLSERVTAQGIDSRYYNPSLTLRKSFLDGRLAASIQWQSIDLGLLESNEQRITTSRDDFFTTTNYVYEVDRVILTLSYRLNQVSKQIKFIKSEFGDKEY